MLQRS